MSRRLVAWVGVAALVVLGGSAAGQPGAAEAEAEEPADGAGRGRTAGDPGAGSAGSAGEAEAGGGSASAGGTGTGTAGGSGTGAGSGGGSGSAAGSDQYLTLPPEVGAPDVSAAASPTVVSLGGRFTVYVTATFGAGVEVNLREPVDLGPAFEVRRKLSEDRPSRDGRTTREWQLDVTPWELGELRIAPIAVTFTSQGHAGQVQTNAVPLKIIGVLGEMVDDPKAMRGMASPTGLSMRDWFWIWCAAAAGAAVGVIVAALWLRGRRRQRRLVGGALARPRIRIDMTGERALERLLAIEQSGVLDRDLERKLGYTDMVEVIRVYLGARYRIAVHDLTSLELLRRLGAAAPADEVAMVAGWLDDCDLVKYGGQRASPAEAGKALDDARALIVVTTQLRGAARPAVAKEAA